MLKRLFLIWRLRSFTSSLLGSRNVFQKTEAKQTRKAEEWVTEQESDFLVLDHSCIWEEASTSWDVKKKTFLLWTGQKLGIRNSSKMSEVVPPLWSSYLKATCGIGQAPKTREQSFYNPYCLCASYFLYSFHGCSPLVLNVIKTCINYHLSWTLKSETKGREFVV